MKKLIFTSFGFKYSLPPEANYVFDVRFIPNPFYIAELRPLSGKDEPVRKYIMSFAEAESFLTSSVLFLDFVIPCYLGSDRETLHVAVGCTGGRHRSVAFVEWFGEHYRNVSTGIAGNFGMELRHRDIDKAPDL